MALFCPTCGLENQPDRNFCRGCGTNLRAVKSAIELGSPSPPTIDGMEATRKAVADIVLQKLSGLQVKKTTDLKKVIEQAEKLLESEETKKVRHLRDGVVRMFYLYGVVGVAMGIILGASGATEEWAPVVALFLLTMGIPLIVALIRLGRLTHRGESPRSKLLETGSAPIDLPQPVDRRPASVTEHTTQHLDEVLHQRPNIRETHRSE